MLQMDDGKMNSFSFEMIKQVNDALDKLLLEPGLVSLLLVGNKKAFSAGFDLSVMGGPPSEIKRQLFVEGSNLALRLFNFPRPVIFGCSGHGLALGAIILLGGDLRKLIESLNRIESQMENTGIGVRGPKFKIGMNEVTIGMVVPVSGVEFARHKLDPRHLTRAVTLGYVYTPDEAQEVGYLDIVTDEESFMSTCLEHAGKLAKLKDHPYRSTKRYEKGHIAKRVEESVFSDSQRLLAKM